MELATKTTMIGWSEPPAVMGARWLIDECGAHDFRSVAVLVPGRRVRRLLQRALLQATRERGGGGAVMAPRVLTPTGLVETFFARVQPLTIASPSIGLLHWLEAFNGLAPSDARLLDPHGESVQERQALARVRQLRGVCDELDAIGLLPGAVPERYGVIGSSKRWHALEVLRADAHALLRDAGLVESTVERRRMVDQGLLLSDAPSRLLVVGVSDPGTLVAAAIQALADRTTILVDAPESEAAHFDSLGRPDPTAWNNRPSPIEFSSMSLVDRPIDAAEQVVDELAALHEERGPFAPGEVVVGLCDETFSNLIERAGRRCGAPLRASVGPALGQCEAAAVLEGLRLFLCDSSVNSFSKLLRLPSIEELLSSDQTDVDLLRLLDEWRADRVGGTLADLRSSHVGQRSLELRPLLEALLALETYVETIRQADSASRICQALSTFLEVVFAGREEDEQLREELLPIAEVLESVAHAPGELGFSAETVIHLCLDVLAQSNRRPEAIDNAIELLGWLELRHDLARDIVLVAVNESGELTSNVADGWLPDSIREKLGLSSESQRRARDAHAMHVLCNRSRSLKTIVARRNVEGDPIAPSRLFLGAGGEESARRVAATMDDKERQPRTVPAFALAGTPVPVNDSHFDAPLPPESIDVQQLSVTAFSSWIRSPLRYWLERCERLESFDPEVLELDPLAFGNLAHDALKAFGGGPLRDSSNPAEIMDFLGEALDRLVEQHYGRPCAPAIALQHETLRARFERFAYVQAQEVRNGWHIQESENKVVGTLEIPGADSVRLIGRIDRIDRHDDGRLRVLDYKTSEKRTRPSYALAKDGTWRDLQLPLYYHLIRQRDENFSGEITLGYVSLCREAKDIGIETARWSEEELEDGIRRAQEIVCEMRSGQFEGGTAKPGRTIDAIDRILRTGVLDISGGIEDAEDLE